MLEMEIIWDLPDEPGNVAHIAEHDLTQDEVAEVLRNPDAEFEKSTSTGSPVKFGWTSTGRHIIVIVEVVEEDYSVVYPLTAYDVPERRGAK